MAVNLTVPDRENVYPIEGVDIGIAASGIRKAGRNDLTVFRLAPSCSVAGVFTQNRFRAAPVQICETHLAGGAETRALVVNTGNANAGTGTEGLANAQKTCVELARLLAIEPQQVLPFSTGVILEPLPIDRLIAALPVAISHLSPNNWFDAAYSIMTTDTEAKIVSTRLNIQGHNTTITGISKGAGMIRPNMATMLAYLATDAAVAPNLLRSMLRSITEKSFNRITVDGDTSTNDSFILIATGKNGLQINSENDAGYDALYDALLQAAIQLAQKIVRDGEGATKFIQITVEQAHNSNEALAVAYAVAHSPLVKTAFFASDPNLGRILAAIGYAGINDLDTSQVKLWLGDVLVASHGQRHPDYREEQGQNVMQQDEIKVRIALGRGTAQETVYTSDLSHDYVSINADYRS